MNNGDGTYRVYYPSTMFSGETILMQCEGYETEEEARKHCTDVYPDIDWIDVSKLTRLIVARSYDTWCVSHY